MAAQASTLELQWVRHRPSRLGSWLRTGRRKYLGTASLIIIVTFVAVAITGPLISPYDPLEVHTEFALNAPGGAFALGPPLEAPLRQALLGEPEPLAVVDENLDGGPAPGSKDEEASGEGVGGELLLAEPGQGVDPLPPVRRLHRHQDAHLWGDLKHDG